MENDVCFSGLFWLYYSLVKFLPGFQNLYRSMTRCIAALSFKMRRECILELASIVLSRCLVLGSSGPGMPWIRHHTMPRLCQSALPPVANYLQSHYFCNVLSARLLSVRNLTVSCLTTFHCVCSPFHQSCNLKKCNLRIIHNSTQAVPMAVWKGPFKHAIYPRSKPCWRPTALCLAWNEPFKQFLNPCSCLLVA